MDLHPLEWELEPEQPLSAPVLDWELLVLLQAIMEAHQVSLLAHAMLQATELVLERRECYPSLNMKPV